MLGLGLHGPVFVATATAIALAVDGVRLPFYFVTESEEIFQAWPGVIAGLVGVAIGTLADERLLRRIPERIFRRVVSGILLGIGVLLLVASPG